MTEGVVFVAIEGARRHHGAVFVMAVAAVLALSVVYDFPFCPFAALTGVPCPGCGLGRATLALLHGHVHEALRFHPLVLVVLPALALVAASQHRAGRDVLPSIRGAAETRARAWLAAGAGVLLLAALFVVWAIRLAGGLGGPAPVLSVWAALGR